MTEGIEREEYIARGRYEKNEYGERIIATFPKKIRVLSFERPQKYEYLKKRVDKVLAMKYPNAQVYWF